MNRRRLMTRTALIGAGAALAPNLLLRPAHAHESFAEGPVVETAEGKVKGLADGDVSVFRGLRYGAPTGGANRFMPPKKPASFTGVWEAFQFGPIAPQFEPGEPRGDDRMRPIQPPGLAEDEDCLRLNIYTTATDRNAKKPVMLWLHGGGFTSGAGSMPLYHGQGLARHGDVVVVTINHRLNAFGFTYLGDILGADYADSGNVGIMDAVRALEWVRDNIEGFGGDPGNVTIFGESGGGAKVSTLMAMPAAQGLYHRAVIESGPGLKMATPDEATESAEKLLKAAGIDRSNAGDLQTISQDKLVSAFNAAGASFGPVVDGDVLPRDPFSPDATPLAADIPLLIGTNRHEASFFFRHTLDPDMTEQEMRERLAGPAGDDVSDVVQTFEQANPDASPWEIFLLVTSWRAFVADSIRLAERKAQQSAPVYMYRFDWEIPLQDGALYSMHTAEIPFVFNNLENAAWYIGDMPPQSLADRMSLAWAHFARTGDPNIGDLPDWPQYDADKRSTMIFNTESRVVDDPAAAERKVMMSQES